MFCWNDGYDELVVGVKFDRHRHNQAWEGSVPVTGINNLWVQIIEVYMQFNIVTQSSNKKCTVRILSTISKDLNLEENNNNKKRILHRGKDGKFSSIGHLVRRILIGQ